MGLWNGERGGGTLPDEPKELAESRLDNIVVEICGIDESIATMQDRRVALAREIYEIRDYLGAKIDKAAEVARSKDNH